MKECIVVLLPKSPLPKKGRIGPIKWQNWYRGCQKAKELLSNESALYVLIPSEFQTGGEFETVFYRGILAGLGLDFYNQIETVREGSETIGQLETALKHAKENGVDIIIVWSCREHKWRWSLIKDWLEVPESVGIKHEVARFGIPRPTEFVRDIFALPLILYFKVRYERRAKEMFLKKVIAGVKEKRAEGEI